MTKALTEKVFIVLLSAALTVMIALGIAFFTMQKNIVALQIQQDNVIKQLENHTSKDFIMRQADVLAVINNRKQKE